MNYKTTFWQQKYFLVISIVSIISLLTIGIWFIKRRRKLI
jgi:hypothetical protein